MWTYILAAAIVGFVFGSRNERRYLVKRLEGITFVCPICGADDMSVGPALLQIWKVKTREKSLERRN